MLKKPFLVFRYSLVEEQQSVLVRRELPDPKGRSVVEAIEGDREFNHNGVEYALMGFKYAQPMTGLRFPPDRFFAGKIAKHGKAHVGEKVPGDIVEYVEDDWIPLLTVIDVIDQYIFVEKNWKFGTEQQTARALQEGLRVPVLNLFNHRIFIEPVTHVEHFWKVIESHQKIFKVELELISPNILDTNKAAREAIKALEEMYNQDKIRTILESESGNLKVPQEPTASYLEYIGEGEGSWRVVTEGPSGGKKAYSSKERVEIIDLPVQESGEVSSGGLFNAEAANKEAGDAQRIVETFAWIEGRSRRD